MFSICSLPAIFPFHISFLILILLSNDIRFLLLFSVQFHVAVFSLIQKYKISLASIRYILITVYFLFPILNALLSCCVIHYMCNLYFILYLRYHSLRNREVSCITTILYTHIASVSIMLRF
jgi:hypothetical protein